MVDPIPLAAVMLAVLFLVFLVWIWRKLMDR